MNDDPELERDDDSPKGRSYFKKRGTRTDGNNRIPVLVGLMLFLIFEPRGLAHRWGMIKAYYRLWPFSHEEAE